jgi:hypothetical protein
MKTKKTERMQIQTIVLAAALFCGSILSFACSPSINYNASSASLSSSSSGSATATTFDSCKFNTCTFSK